MQKKAGHGKVFKASYAGVRKLPSVYPLKFKENFSAVTCFGSANAHNKGFRSRMYLFPSTLF
jgi:hypothetical protein